MSTIYVILGIIGWVATAIIVPLYYYLGAQKPMPAAPPSDVDVH